VAFARVGHHRRRIIRCRALVLAGEGGVSVSLTAIGVSAPIAIKIVRCGLTSVAIVSLTEVVT